MFRLVDRYIGRAACLGTLGVWLGMTLLFLIVSLLSELRDTANDYGTVDALWFIALITPRMAYQIFPVSALSPPIISLISLDLIRIQPSVFELGSFTCSTAWRKKGMSIVPITF